MTCPTRCRPVPRPARRTTGQALAAATHGLANLTIGSALTESTWHTKARVPREAAHDHIQTNAATYPTLADTGHLSDPDWDVLFAHAVDCFLEGLHRYISM